ncbi:MAG: PIN domain-containing protein [Phycisphaerales bacterium]
MRYLLDTNVCIELLRPGRGEPIRLRIDSLGSEDDVVLCSVVRYELVHGAMRSERREQNLERVREFVAQFPSLAFDDAAADHAADIRAALDAAGLPVGAADVLIASIARSAGAVLVSANVAEFSRVPELRVENWQDRA